MGYGPSNGGGDSSRAHRASRGAHEPLLWLGARRPREQTASRAVGSAEQPINPEGDSGGEVFQDVLPGMRAGGGRV